jgi:hypothetical protein
MPVGEANERLAALLAEAGWTPRALARAVNSAFGQGMVSPTAPYLWRDNGSVPRAPLPALVAHAFSDRLGRPVTTSDIWGDQAPLSSHLLLASAGMNHPWSVEGTRKIARDWIIGGLVERRHFMAVTGAALTGAVSAYLAAELPAAPAAPSASGGTDLLIEQIEASIPLLQQLDDAKGGAASLGYVGAQLRAVALVLHEGSYTSVQTRRLLTALADLGQLAGWMAFDANQYGLAQRYFFTGLRAAHDSGYTTMAAHILADLSFQATTSGRRSDGITLGEAACRHAARASAGVRASVSSRLAYAYAASGLISEFERTYNGAMEIVTGRSPDADPPWLYYLTPGHIDCQGGYALILAGRARLADGDRTGRTLLRRGTVMLRTGAHDWPLGDSSQRRALYEGAWLALAYAARGDLEAACSEARTAIGRLASVRSPRSNTLLHQLAADLRRRTRNPHAASFLPDLECALAAQPHAPGVS